MILRNKLILSCAALAAVATTAVSTTFAWYTANTDVNAKGLTASTESLDDATLMISLNNWDWGSTVDLTDIFANTSKLKPVAYTAGQTAGARNATINLWDSQTNALGNAAVANTDYVQFTLFFKSADTGSINVKNTKFTLARSTETLVEKVKLSTTGIPVTTSTYTVDVLRALVVDVDVQTGHECATEPANAAAGFTAGQFGDASHTAYSADNLAAGDSVTTENKANWNAHTYYNAVKNLPQGTSGQEGYKAAIATDKASSETTQTQLSTSVSQFASAQLGSTGAGSLTLGQASVLAVTYTIYLDGWDKFCFNACQNQTITLDLEYQGAYVSANSGSGSGSGN